MLCSNRFWVYRVYQFHHRGIFGASGGTWTHNQRSHNPLLYPIEPRSPAFLVGLGGFEPPDDRIKTCCLTAWLQPNIYWYYKTIFLIVNNHNSLLALSIIYCFHSIFHFNAIILKFFIFFSIVYISLLLSENSFFLKGYFLFLS